MNTASMPKTLNLELATMNQFGIWTGGADSRKMTSVNATSILGGLRFWTEALMRAQGRHVCKEQGRCPHGKGGSGACDACRIFGCTGISRQFSLQISHRAIPAAGLEKAKRCVKLAQYRHDDQQGRPQVPTYYFTTGYTGPLTLRLAARRPSMSDGNTLALPGEVLAALALQLEFGTLGAYDQYGCGLVAFEQQEQAELLRNLALGCPAGGGTAQAHGVTLKDFFFFKGKTAGGPEEQMAEIRYQVRAGFREKKLGKELRHWFCGSLTRDQANGKANSGTNYALSMDQSGRVYGWGHFARSGINPDYLACREQVLGIVHTTMQRALGQSLVWKEFGAPARDSASPADWPAYFENLLKTSWRTLP